MSVVAIGNFDGLHLGHQTLLQKTVDIANQAGKPSVAFTFTPHPRKAPRLLSDRQKESKIRALGIAQVILQVFDPEFAALSPTQFIQQVLIDQLNASHVVIGPDFAFGSKAQGNAQTLANDTRFQTYLIEPVWVDGEICSSSLIREAVSKGDLEKAKRLLGRPYSLTGKVIPGAGRGQQLGFPTANLAVDQEVLPPHGVYAMHSETLGKAATNIGKRPTFDDENLVHIEAHFLDFQGNLYGQELEIFFDYKIRDEQAFESAEALRTQIVLDLDAVRANPRAHWGSRHQ